MRTQLLANCLLFRPKSTFALSPATPKTRKRWCLHWRLRKSVSNQSFPVLYIVLLSARTPPRDCKFVQRTVVGGLRKNVTQQLNEEQNNNNSANIYRPTLFSLKNARILQTSITNVHHTIFASQNNIFGTTTRRNFFPPPFFRWPTIQQPKISKAGVYGVSCATP